MGVALFALNLFPQGRWTRQHVGQAARQTVALSVSCVCLADNELSYNRLLHRKITIYDIGLRTLRTAFACQHVWRSATPHYATPLWIHRENN